MTRHPHRAADRAATAGDLWWAAAMLRLVDWKDTQRQREMPQLAERLALLGDALDDAQRAAKEAG